MADEYSTKRIINLPAESGPAEGDVFVVDNESTGTKKLPISGLIDPIPTQGSNNAVSSGGVWNEITNLKEDLTKIDDGLNDISGVFHYDDFAVGALSKSNSIITFDSTDKRMVSTPKSICFPVDITIVPADGYRMYIHWTDGRPYSTSNTGWVTSPITVNANQWFMMTLRKVASDTGYEANAIDFVNKFSVTPSPLRIAEDAVFHKKTVYVSTGGSDETGVGTLGNPYKTFAKAISVGAEHIVARSGTYNEAISINGGDIRISAYWETFVSGSVTDRPKIIIDGANTIETALTIENCSNVILEDVLVRNCTNDGAIINKCDYAYIQNCEFSNNGRNGITINYSNGVIKNSYGNSNGNDGFNMNYFGDTHFYNCGGHDNGDDGISHHQGTTGSINGGEWYNNVKGGIASPAHGSKVDIYNIYSHNNGYGIYANADADTVARTFRVWNSVLTNNSHYGLSSKRNTAILYNCKITGNTEGQTTAPSGGSIITL